ncbi:FAD-binding and (Fe-S)-binding domain-containing protein [Sinomonas sp. ASV486]|uniref:FAD-binding and (Fe-S)-binding domain-containing protein n=1 Tax=Sinomonas sp. ASV486 TaxID=3051170 RepID=UPI0027DCE890|nr:FAD-binding and (Fe-S)-binding domain-containing protein [Sinomonas sp. ASV486]MDQ4490123.1 FAD-binding and (Fe-S)-binding domain-containing protein [Sinomonas sp. ASV486]
MTSVALRTDLTTRAAYVSDASIYRRVPAAVVEPHTVEDIREALRTAAERGWPVTCRGGGTSVAGNAIGDGLVIDTSRYFNEILQIDPQARTARIRPGVVCDALRDAAAPFGLTYGPDPSTHSRCTVGGMVANNACGSHSVAWGSAAENLVSLKVMLADGREVEIGADSCSDPVLEDRLRQIRDAHLMVLRNELGQFPRQVSGYGLHYLLPENGFDMAKVFAGTEGTCGVITELTVRLVERPQATALAVLGFADVFDAAAAAPLLRRPGVYTVEGMGADLLAALRSRPGRETAGSELPEGGGWLYVELGAGTADEAGEAARSLVDALMREGRIVDSVVVTGHDEARALWTIREASAGIVTRLPDGGEAWPGWEDSAVPPEHLADYLRDLYALLGRHGLQGIPFGHFGEGCVHVRIDFGLGTEDGVAGYRSFIEEAAALVARHGGSLSGEHGDGRARSELLPVIYSTEALGAFAEFKAAFDPDNFFNPGILVDAEPIDQGIRPGPGIRHFDLTPVHAFSRDGGSFVSATNRCVGVGLCRSDVGSMCPSYQATRDEVHSTRGRARILAEMLRGESVTDGWQSKETLEALDLCLSCKACSSECPVNVDMATYKAEFLYHHYNGRLRPMAHYAMGWLPLTSRVLEAIPGSARLANWILGFRPAEELVKRLAGIEPKRRMIHFAPVTLRKWFAKRAAAIEAEGERPAVVRSTVMLWPDTLTNFNAPDVGQAAVEVLEALGYRVVLPQGQVCCGLTWHSTGQLDMAKKVMSQSLDALEEALSQNLPIVGLEPSCTVMLTHEITELLPDDPRAAQLAGQVVTLAELVAEHDGAWPFGVVDAPAISQVHCHQEAQGTYDPDLAVLRKLGIDTDVIGSGCCGLAGNFGFEPGHFEVSQGLGERELFPKVRAKGESTLVLADGFSCRTQVQQGTGVRAQHLAEVLRGALSSEAGGQSVPQGIPVEG